IGWGKKSGSRAEIEHRNNEIYRQYMDGTSVAELAEMYYLSEERIRGILYGQHTELS
ncbi:MAG: mor transcription activator family protein, partial [Paenibacillus sp.]|nr:mor transcription activator family protein [Paenibacillus sp.]